MLGAPKKNTSLGTSMKIMCDLCIFPLRLGISINVRTHLFPFVFFSFVCIAVKQAIAILEIDLRSPKMNV